MPVFASPRLVIFDNDGTLVPSHAVVNRSIQSAFARFCAEKGIEAEIPTDEQICALTGQPGELFYRALLPEGWKQLSGELRERSLDAEVAVILEQGCFYPGIQELLVSLRERGVRLAVATNGGQRYISAVAERLNYAALFDRVYFHGLDGMASKKEMGWRALQELGPPPALFVGDRRSDLDAALAIGIPFVGCLYGYGSSEELSSADATAATPADLTRLLLDGSRP